MSKPRGRRVDVIKHYRIVDGEEVVIKFNTKRIRQRLGKNTRLSDLERTNHKAHYTDPVEHTINAHMDTTGARDPSRIRHAQTKARRTFEAGIDACQI